MKLTLEELDSIYDELAEKIDNNPMLNETYQNGLINGMKRLKTAIEARVKSETKQGTIQDVLKNCDCDFQVEAHESCKERQTATLVFNVNDVEFTIEIKGND